MHFKKTNANIKKRTYSWFTLIKPCVPLVTGLFLFTLLFAEDTSPQVPQEQIQSELSVPNVPIVESDKAKTKAETSEKDTDQGDAKIVQMPEGKLYLDFKGMTLLNVFSVLSQLSGINFVSGREVSERKVNMTLDNVTLEGALDALSRGANINYDFYPDRNLYVFRGSAFKEDDPPLVSRVFKLYYIRVSPIKEIDVQLGGGGGEGGGEFVQYKGENTKDTPLFKIIKELMSDRGKMEVDFRSNSLVIVETEDRMKMIEQVIVELDRPIDQVLINVIIIEALDDYTKYFGVEWNSVTGNTEGKFGTIVGGSAGTRFPFNLSGPTWLGKDEWFKTMQSTVLGNSTPGAAGAENSYTPGAQNFSSLSAQLKALETAQKLKVIAKPSILVLDNHSSVIAIMTDQAIGTKESQVSIGTSGSSSTTETERASVGTMLRVTPFINSDNRITLTVEPQFVTASTSTFISGTADPTSRYSRTTMMVNDGQTIVLGGLLYSQSTQMERKVPYLADIPVFGEMFKYRKTLLQDRELVAFVTPKIIRDPSQLQPVSLNDSRMRMDDEFAPFYKVKKKAWYKKLTKENVPEAGGGAADIKERDTLMDMAAEKLENELEQSTEKLAPDSIIESDGRPIVINAKAGTMTR